MKVLNRVGRHQGQHKEKCEGKGKVDNTKIQKAEEKVGKK